MTTPTLTWDLPTMGLIIGELPGGDLPVAWWSSLDEGVLTAWETYRQDLKTWKDAFTELMDLSGLDVSKMKFHHIGSLLIGLEPLANTKPPTWWRHDEKVGVWVPRKRSQSEKNSEISQRWAKLRKVPIPIEYLPGLPQAVWTNGKPYPIAARKPGKALLVFTGVDPDMADPPFQPDNRWTRMKLSTFHLLRERQSGKAVKWPPEDKTGVKRGGQL